MRFRRSWFEAAVRVALAAATIAAMSAAGGAALAAEGDAPPETAPAPAATRPALPPALRPLPPIGTEGGAAGDAKVVEEFKLGKGMAKAKIGFFELHGYFRWRTDLFQNLDLRSNDLLDANGVPYRPQNLDFSSVRFPVILPLTETDDNAGITPGGTAESGRGAETLAGTNMRLRLEPVINASELLRVKMTIDILDNVVLGSTPEGYNPGTTARSADVPTTAFSGSLAPPDWRSGFTDSIRVKRLWAEVRTPYGELRFGRMGSHWGLGLLANDGNCLDCDYGDHVDRILFATKLDRFVIVPALDIPVSGWTSARETDFFGQPYDLDQLDDVHQYILAVARRDTPEELEALRLRGEFSFNYGVYFVFRNQSFSGTEAGAARPGEPGMIVRPRLDYLLSPVNAEAYIPDLWARFVWGPLTLEAEAVFVYGRVESNPLSGNNCGDASADLMGDADERARAICRIMQFGTALHASLKLLDDKLTIRFRGGIATGDQGEGIVPTTSTGLAPEHTTDSKLTAFRFDRDYFVDLILFRQILGTISGATYFNLGGTYEALPGLNLKLDAIYSLAVEPVSLPGNKPGLGFEVDAEISYTTKDGFFGAAQAGVLIPLNGLDFPSRLYAPSFNVGGVDPGDINAGVAFTLQGFLGIRF